MAKPKITCLSPRIGTVSTSKLELRAGIATPISATRQSASARGYNYKWVKARERFLRAHPLCVYCYKQGIIKAATVVDHIVPHRGNMGLFWDSDNNWQSLCYHHHNSDKQKAEKNDPNL